MAGMDTQYGKGNKSYCSLLGDSNQQLVTVDEESVEVRLARALRAAGFYPELPASLVQPTAPLPQVDAPVPQPAAFVPQPPFDHSDGREIEDATATPVVSLKRKREDGKIPCTNVAQRCTRLFPPNLQNNNGKFCTQCCNAAARKGMDVFTVHGLQMPKKAKGLLAEWETGENEMPKQRLQTQNALPPSAPVQEPHFQGAYTRNAHAQGPSNPYTQDSYPVSVPLKAEPVPIPRQDPKSAPRRNDGKQQQQRAMPLSSAAPPAGNSGRNAPNVNYAMQAGMANGYGQLPMRNGDSQRVFTAGQHQAVMPVQSNGNSQRVFATGQHQAMPVESNATFALPNPTQVATYPSQVVWTTGQHQAMMPVQSNATFALPNAQSGWSNTTQVAAYPTQYGAPTPLAGAPGNFGVPGHANGVHGLATQETADSWLLEAIETTRRDSGVDYDQQQPF